MYYFAIFNIIKPDCILKPINDQQLESYPLIRKTYFGFKMISQIQAQNLTSETDLSLFMAISKIMDLAQKRLIYVILTQLTI